MFRKIVIGAALFGMASCATIHINVIFPQEKIESAAESFLLELEEDLDGGTSSRPQDRQWRLAIFRLGPAPLHARTISARVSMDSEVIERARESMRRRLAETRAFKSRGLVGENRVGLLEVIGSRDALDELSRAERESLYRLVSEENHDRMTVYREVVSINSMPAEDLARVQESFANVYRRMAREGEWVQDADGQWARQGGGE